MRAARYYDNHDIRIEEIPFAEALQMIATGEIMDAKTVVALQALALARLTGDPRPWLRENAERTLRQMTGNAVVTRAWSASDRRAYWTRWVRRNAGSIRSVL